MENEGFWLVWCPQRDVPTHRHDSFLDAQKEAMRLAEKHPGNTFYVLVATGMASTRQAVWQNLGC